MIAPFDTPARFEIVSMVVRSYPSSAIAVALGGIAVTIYAWLDDRRRGQR